jgi:hypothetical protein
MNHIVAIPSVASYHPQLPARYVQDYNLGARIEIGVVYNPHDIDDASKTAKLLRSKFGVQILSP